MPVTTRIFFLVFCVGMLLFPLQTCPAAGFNTVKNATFKASSPIVVGTTFKELNRATGQRSVRVNLSEFPVPCPSGRTPDIDVNVKSLLSLAVIGGTTYFDPWASIIIRKTQDATGFNIYVAIKTVNNNILGCDPGCPTCNFCDACTGSDPNPNCSDRLYVQLGITFLCK